MSCMITDDESVESIMKQQKVAHLFIKVRIDLINGIINRDDLFVVRQKWLRYFLPLNIEFVAGEHVKLSVTDIGFMCMCYAWKRSGTNTLLTLRTHSNNISLVQPEVTIDDIFSTHADLVILSCQHTNECRTYWPTQRHITQLRLRVANVIVRYFDHGVSSRAELIRVVSEWTQQPLSYEQSTMYAQRKTPHTLQAQTVDQEVSEEASGLLWRTCASDLVNNYVRIASRIFYKIERDNDVVREYSPSGTCMAPRLNRATHARLNDWVLMRCRVEQTEEMSKLFRDIANASWCPMGTETQRFRNRDTRTDVTAPLQLLESEIGVTLGQHMHERSLARLQEIASDPDGLFWDSLLLALLSYAMRQSVHMDWTLRYVFVDGHSRETQHKIKDVSDAHLKRPILIRLQRRWHIMHEQRLLPCEDLSHAVLSWMYIMRTQFHCMTEQGEDLISIIETFITNQSIQL